ncbi:MAG: hypothetical protein ACM3XZ_08610 [Betaproteobacteria bacterium]
MRTWLAEGLAPLQDGFWRDLGRLFLVTVAAVSLLSACAAWAVNAYFNSTVAGLIGGVGEYDFMLHVRADAREQAARQLAAYLPKAFPGAKFKPGLTIAGQASFLVDLPAKMRTRTVMEGINSSFASLPGFSGHTVLVTPSVVVDGVAPGAIRFFLDRLERLPGVEFAFADGQDLVVAVDRRHRAEDVEKAAADLLKQYRLIEVRFPMGYEVRDLREAGERLATAVNRKFGGGALDVTRRDPGDDFRSFQASLTEMRRFLLSYASDVSVKLNPNVTLKPRDELVIGDQLPTPGGRFGPTALRVMVTGIEGNVAHGVTVQGDPTPQTAAKSPTQKEAAAAVFPAGRAYLVKPGNRVGELVGSATIHNQRYALSASMDEGLKLLDQLQVVAKHAVATAARVQSTLASYQQTLDQIDRAQTALAQVQRGLSGPLDGLGKVNTDSLVLFLNQAVAGLDDLLGKMSGVAEAKAAMDLAASAAQPTENGGAATQESMTNLADETHRQTDLLSQIIGQINPVTVMLLKWRAQAQNLALQVGNLGLLAQNAGDVRKLVQDLSTATGRTLETMRAIDVEAMKADLEGISRRMEAIAQIDVGSVTRQVRYVKDSLPNLKDEELGRSVRLIERYIGGEIIPGQRLQLLVPARLPLKEVKAEVRQTAGERVSLTVSPAGSLKMDLRGLLLRVLGRVRTTVAGLVAVALVALVLMLDHALVISALRTSWRSGRLPRWWRAGAAWAYGAGVGAALLLTSFVLSGARLPFFGWPSVAGLGGALGLATAGLAGRLAPVEVGELEAGQALGLSYARILREIVIPEGRPGLLHLLNRRALIFPLAAPGPAGRKR